MDPKRLIAVPALCLALATCATTGGTLCSVGPFLPDPGVNERWTRSEKEQLVTLNNSGAEICGWQAART